MTKYLFSRFLVVFILKMFIDWAINIKPQLVYFFDLTEGMGLTILHYALSISVITIGILAIFFCLSLYHLSVRAPLHVIIRLIKFNGFSKICRNYFNKFWSNNIAIVLNDIKFNKYSSIFIAFLFFVLPFSKGNPLFNNYYGVYKEYEIPHDDRSGEHTVYEEVQSYIIHKSEKKLIDSIINNSIGHSDEYTPFYEIKKRGYVFIQAGLFDGYRTIQIEEKGFRIYFECFLYSAIEKLINTFLYFLIPFVIIIYLYHKYVYKK